MNAERAPEEATSPESGDQEIGMRSIAQENEPASNIGQLIEQAKEDDAKSVESIKANIGKLFDPDTQKAVDSSRMDAEAMGAQSTVDVPVAEEPKAMPEPKKKSWQFWKK